jgi:hypothetical protein
MVPRLGLRVEEGGIVESSSSTSSAQEWRERPVLHGYNDGVGDGGSRMGAGSRDLVAGGSLDGRWRFVLSGGERCRCS